MLRIHFLQQWFNLSDPAMEEALHDVPVFRDFAGLANWGDALPSDSSILRFRQLLEKHKLAGIDTQRRTNLLALARREPSRASRSTSRLTCIARRPTATAWMGTTYCNSLPSHCRCAGGAMRAPGLRRAVRRAAFA